MQPPIRSHQKFPCKLTATKYLLAVVNHIVCHYISHISAVLMRILLHSQMVIHLTHYVTLLSPEPNTFIKSTAHRITHKGDRSECAHRALDTEVQWVDRPACAARYQIATAGVKRIIRVARWMLARTQRPPFGHTKRHDDHAHSHHTGRANAGRHSRAERVCVYTHQILISCQMFFVGRRVVYIV